MFDILVTSLFCESYAIHVFYLQIIQCLFKNAKHCVINTSDLKKCQWPRPYRFELLEG